MKVQGQHYHTVWPIREPSGRLRVGYIHQPSLPSQFNIRYLDTVADVAKAIEKMYVRGAGCIGVTAGYGMMLGAQEVSGCTNFAVRMSQIGEKLLKTRPTAVNLEYAISRQLAALKNVAIEDRVILAENIARSLEEEDIAACRAIGRHGLELIQDIYAAKRKPVNILTHCNAGWLAFVDYGSATAPIYAAHDAGIPVHVWVDMTGPRNQGGRLTAWELLEHGVPHTVISDNTGAILMQRGLVDFCITGADRVTRRGDVANKIGTLQKAVVAQYFKTPFYVAFPSSTFDFTLFDGCDISIEERDPDEVRYAYGSREGRLERVLLIPMNSPACNIAFDPTPSELITGLITERGICEASESAIRILYPERVELL